MFAVYEKVALSIHIYIWVLLIAYTPVQILKIFICWPIASYWDRSVQGRCLDQPKIFLTDTAFAVVTDLIILMIPVPILWNIRMPLRKKLKILIMLGAGGGAVGVACYREYRIYIFQRSIDVTGDFVMMNLLGYAASRPSMAYLFSDLPTHHQDHRNYHWHSVRLFTGHQPYA